MDRHLSDTPFLIDGRLSLADIFVGYAIHWAHFQGLLGSFIHLEAYRRRLLQMPKCTFTPLGPDQGLE